MPQVFRSNTGRKALAVSIIVGVILVVGWCIWMLLLPPEKVEQTAPKKPVETIKPTEPAELQKTGVDKAATTTQLGELEAVDELAQPEARDLATAPAVRQEAPTQPAPEAPSTDPVTQQMIDAGIPESEHFFARRLLITVDGWNWGFIRLCGCNQHPFQSIAPVERFRIINEYVTSHYTGWSHAYGTLQGYGRW